ncbi:MAG TPA: hypothetical protein PL151_09115 [Phycisphaerae bacterium]|nr:hypothetical protein [Phycisphaerae bacterium]
MSSAARVIVGVIVTVWLGRVDAAQAQGTFFLKPYSLGRTSIEGLAEQQACWLFKEDKPENLRVPAGLTGRLYYYTGEVAGRSVVAVVKSGKTRELYIDLDGDGDLSDEKPVTAKRVRSSIRYGWSMTYQFGPLAFAGSASQPATSETVSSASPTSSDQASSAVTADAAADDDEGSATEASSVPRFYVEQLDLDYLIVRPAACRRGTVRVGDRSFPVYVMDANYNGRYDDVLQSPPDSANRIVADLIALDINRSGEIEYDPYGVSELQPLTRLIQFGGKYYSLRVASDGSSLTLEEAEPVMGTLSLGKHDADLVVRSENGVFQVTTKQGRCELPAGTYRLLHVLLRARDEKKAEWTLRGRAPENKPVTFRVGEGKITTLGVGPPLQVRTVQRTHRTLLSGRVVSFGASFVDAAGIEYEPGADRGMTRSPAPSVKIYDESDKLLVVGQFEYG